MGEVWFAPGDPSLPTPWKGVIDGNTGCLYYWNPETNITQYEKPVYWVSSPSLSSSCSPGYFYPPPSTASNYDHHSQYPNLYPHHQTPTETVINGYTFPTQFPFPNHTQTPTNQPIYPQSQSMVEPIYTEFSSFYPASNIDPLVPTFQSPCDLNPSIPTFVPQLQFLDPNLLSSSLSPGKYEPQPIPLGPNAAPALAVQTTDLDHSTPSKFPDPSFDFEEMATPQLTCFHLEQTAELQEVSETAAQTPTIPRGGFENARETYHTTILRDEYSSKTSFPVELVQTVALRIAHSTSDAEKHACNRRPMEKLWDDNGELRPMGSVFKATPIFFLINMKKPLLSVGVMYGQMMGSAELYPIGRATDLLLLADSRRILDKSGGPLVHWELRSMVTEVARLYLNCSLEKTMTSLGNMPGETEPSAPVNHFWNLVVDVDNFSLVTTLISGLKPILLSMSFVESPVILEVYLPESYYQGIKHEVVAFDKFLVCSFHFIKLIETLRVAHLLATLPNWKARETNALASSKGGSQYELRLESSIESFTRNSQRFFINMHGRGIEVQCSVMYHWLPYSLNWDQRSICDAFLSHEFSMSCATVKFLLSEFCKSGSKFQNKAIVEASLENIGLKVVICAHWKVMDYALHLVGALSIETVGHTISTALVYDQNFCGALLVLELHLGLLIVVVLSFAAIEQLLTIGINSDGLVIALMSDSCNKKLSVCSLITNATNRKIWGQFISLEKCKLDGQLNFLVQCIFQIEYPLMDKSCILHSSGKHLDQSHFLVQLQKNSGIIYFAIHEQLKQTYRVNCFISLVEVYLVNYLLFFEDKMFEHWSNKSSKFGECRVHELSQHRDKMKIFPKLDDTSSKLVVIKSVKVVLTQAVIFYYYVVWLISLVILHFGCGPYFFLCECVGHFRTDAENLTIINGGATDDNMLSCALATSTLGHLKRSALLEFFVGHLQAEPTLLRVTYAVFSVAAIKLGHHNSSLEQADDLLKVNYIVMPLRYCSDAQLTMANSTVLLDVVLHFPAHELYYIAPSMINLFEATFTHNWGYWLNWQIMPHAPWDLTIMIIASFIVRRRVVQALYWHLYAGGAWLQHSLPFGSPFYKIANLLAFVIIFGGIHAANSLGILQTGQEVYNVHSYRKEVNTHRLLIFTSNVVVMKKAAGCAICIPNQQTAQVLLFFNPSIPTCKVLVPTFVMEKWRVEATGMLNEVTERRMVSVERLWAHFPISTCLRPEDMPLFKGGGMLGLLCYNYLLTWVNVLGYLNGLYIGLYNYMGNCIRIGSSCKRISRVC